MFLKKTNKPLHYEDRAKSAKPTMIILHYTGMQTMLAARERLTDPTSKVSAHYLVDTDGQVFDLVPEDKRAWHAGLSYWHGETDINSYSVGIEMVNPGHELGYKPFTSQQMQAVMDLCQGIQSRHKIEYVLGHSDIAPERKIDPGELFPWEWLAGHGVGLWPKPTDADLQKAEDISCNDYEVERLLTQFGYNPMGAYVDVVSAFHRHFAPEKFKTGEQEKVDMDTVVKLVSLVRQSGNKLVV
ncbi:MAG: N-acetylmuramoyl-L-alanine amidase [Alphaproteobacteria bacterium]|nr:N-acetylmuramoyl-L-alanine amidase [Alphaproteobacteria bacterium]